MNSAGRHATEQIEHEEPNSAQPVFDVVAEYPKIKHVAANMEPPSVQEKRGEKRVWSERNASELTARETGGYYAVVSNEPCHSVTEGKLVEKDSDVNDDKRNRNDRETARRDCVSERYRGCAS